MMARALALVAAALLVAAQAADAHPSRRFARKQAERAFAALAAGRPWAITGVGRHRRPAGGGTHIRHVYGRIGGCRQRVTVAPWGVIDSDPPEGPVGACG
jgi:opacity protein-like surface antigen